MRSTFILAICLYSSTVLFAGDWRQFRGNESNGLGDEILPPTSLAATENVSWQVPLPGRGLSSPIVVGDKVFVTCSSGFREDRLHVICFSTKDGSKLWER